MSLYQTKFNTVYYGTIYDHLRFVPYAQSDDGCYDSFGIYNNSNHYQIDDNKETPDSHSLMQILAEHKRMGVG